MELNTINNSDNWGSTTTRLNENFGKISTEVEKVKNSTTKAKGLFSTYDFLKKSCPSPKIGDWAIVGNTIPGEIYECKTAGEWEPTGQTGGGGEVDLTEYLTATEITDITTIL